MRRREDRRGRLAGNGGNKESFRLKKKENNGEELEERSSKQKKRYTQRGGEFELEQKERNTIRKEKREVFLKNFGSSLRGAPSKQKRDMHSYS